MDGHAGLMQWSGILLTADLFLITGNLYINIYIYIYIYTYICIWGEAQRERETYCSSTTGWDSLHSQFSQVHNWIRDN